MGSSDFAFVVFVPFSIFVFFQSVAQRPSQSSVQLHCLVDFLAGPHISFVFQACTLQEPEFKNAGKAGHKKAFYAVNRQLDPNDRKEHSLLICSPSEAIITFSGLLEVTILLSDNFERDLKFQKTLEGRSVQTRVTNVVV